MTASALLLAVSLFLSTPFDDAPACAVRYSGTLISGVRNGEGNPVKRFTLFCLIRKNETGREIDWFLTERGAGGWSWPERYDAIVTDSELTGTSGGIPRLLYDYEGTPTVIPLPSPIVDYSKKLANNAKWAVGKESWEVTQKTKINDRDAWQAVVTTGFGKKKTSWILADAPLLCQLEEKVFVGQGDEHRLTMQLEGFESVSAEELQKQSAAWEKIRSLQTELKRKPAEFRPELTEPQLNAVSKALPELKKLATDTPFSALVTAISSDLRGQNDRSSDIARLQDKYIGKAAPTFEFLLLDNKTSVSSDELKEQVVVLHFWEYQAEPLVEPYGQVGYLDFLNDRRKKLGVKIFGVAIDERFGQPQTFGAAAKSAQRLKTFMNLGYPIGGDDGKLLKKFGDPREANAKLPLWVVIGADGKVAHYHAGLYSINTDEGLKELDEQLIKLIRQARGK